MPGFNHTTENMKTKTLLGFFLLSLMTFCISACQDDAENILFSGSELIDETGTCTNTISSTVLYLNGWEVSLHIKVKMMYRNNTPSLILARI